MPTKIGHSQIKAGPDGGLAEGEFIAYPSTFTREPDSTGDVVAKGAFLRGIKDRADKGIKLPCLYGHRSDDPDYYIGHAVTECEDERGWKIHGKFDLDSPKGAHVYRLVRDGLLRELSFAYETRDSAPVTLADGRKARELRDLDVTEFSFVPQGANRDTHVAQVKSPNHAARVRKVRAAHLKAQFGHLN